MNETKSLRIAVIILSFILIITSSVSFFTVRHYKQRLERIGIELRNAENRERDIADAVERYAQRTEQIFDQSFDTIGAIRQAVESLQIIFADLTEQLSSLTSSEYDVGDEK